MDKVEQKLAEIQNAINDYRGEMKKGFDRINSKVDVTDEYDESKDPIIQKMDRTHNSMVLTLEKLQNYEENQNMIKSELKQIIKGLDR
jgi:uncharacterized coiled-coil DUF342 family protein